MERGTQRIGIGIPTLNRYDILKTFLPYYQESTLYPIYIVDNGNQGIKHSNVIIQNKNIGVAASWNLLCNIIFEHHEYAIILNDDCMFNLSKENLESIIKRYPNQFIRATPDWCAFILSKSIYNKVGQFDEGFFPAYYEDNDYEYRMKLLRIPIIKTPFLNPLIHRSSSSAEKDPSIFEAAKANKKRYVQKWGGLPTYEKYDKPFGK
jgi:GT2 family glycosyltransferase